MAGLLKQFFEGRRTYQPVQSLPTEGWCQAAGLARISLVWPWYAVAEPEPLVDSHGRAVGTRPSIELHAPRTDQDVVLIVWTEPGGGLVSGADWAMSVARLYQGRLEYNAPIALNGAMGHIARINAGADTTWRVIVPRQDNTVQLEVRAPTAHADPYWTQIETMLATWGWDD